MVQYSWAIMAAMLLVLGVIHPTQALDCQQVEFGFLFNAWSSATIGYCQQACAVASNSNYSWQIAHVDGCQGEDGLSGITSNGQEAPNGSCYCSYSFVMWRVHKTDQRGESCALSEIAKRVANDAKPMFQVTRISDVYCDSQGG
jgi:hypothetical protein